MYAKRPGTDWQLEELKPWTGPSGVVEITKLEHRYLGMEGRGSDEMRILMRTEQSRVLYNGEENENVRHIKSWIDRLGRLRKMEYLIMPSNNRFTRVTIVYDVDSSIRIESPIK